nr:MAG TPA: putative zinc-ribbon domain protein [Caudoviricetes sp.]
MKEHNGSPFTIAVLQLTRNGEIVGKVFKLKCGTCGEEKTKAVESLNSMAIQDALEELFEESRLHASYHATNKEHQP